MIKSSAIITISVSHGVVIRHPTTFTDLTYPCHFQPVYIPSLLFLWPLKKVAGNNPEDHPRTAPHTRTFQITVEWLAYRLRKEELYLEATQPKRDRNGAIHDSEWEDFWGSAIGCISHPKAGTTTQFLNESSRTRGCSKLAELKMDYPAAKYIGVYRSSLRLNNILFRSCSK